MQTFSSSGVDSCEELDERNLLSVLSGPQDSKPYNRMEGSC